MCGVPCSEGPSLVLNTTFVGRSPNVDGPLQSEEYFDRYRIPDSFVAMESYDNGRQVLPHSHQRAVAVLNEHSESLIVLRCRSLADGCAVCEELGVCELYLPG